LLLLYHPAMVEVFVERGNQLAASRQLMLQFEDEANYAAALALVSIHCAIALNDALMVKLTGRPHRGDDHMESVQATRKQCESRRIPDSARGLRHLEKLIRAKTKVSYSEQITTMDVALSLVLDVERFETWVLPLIKS
jgi:hypothetical protein